MAQLCSAYQTSDGCSQPLAFDPAGFAHNQEEPPQDGERTSNAYVGEKDNPVKHILHKADAPAHP